MNLTRNLIFLFSIFPAIAYSQSSDSLFKSREISHVLKVLAGDSLKGRGNSTGDLFKAGLFIGQKFKEYGLQPLPGVSGYFLPFRPYGGETKIISDNLIWNGKKVLHGKFVYMHPSPGNYGVKRLSDFTIIHSESSFTGEILQRYQDAPTDLLIWTSKKQPDGKEYFPEELKAPQHNLLHNILLVYSESPPDSISLSGLSNYYTAVEYNVIATLPGRSRPDEVIMFSAHYDHIGINPIEKDSILNGANDDASGVTALIALANYFSKKNDNERTIMFCAFAAEELGLIGSGEFAKQVIPEKVIADINIEMIGIPEYGKNSIFITGKNFSSLPLLLEKEFKNTPVKVKREPVATKQLFKRSDNFSFAKLGIPAHSIMSSDDGDPCYHKPCDEVKRIDVINMRNIIKAIAVVTENLINGKKTPTRVKAEQLK